MTTVKPFNIGDELESSQKTPSVASNGISGIASNVSSATVSSTSSVVRMKYEMCKNFREKGVCKYGDRCLFAHGEHQLIKRGQPETKTPPKTEEKDKEEIKIEENSIA